MRLAQTDLHVAPISLGAGDLGTRTKDDAAFAALDAYVKAGGNFLDTAHVYGTGAEEGPGASEETLGRWIHSRGHRSDLVIATKGGHPPIAGYPHESDFLSPTALANDVSESLERLGIDEIDLYYLHRDDGVTPVDEIVDALNALPGIRYFGASNWSVERLLAANEHARRSERRGFVALQNQWSLAVPIWRPTADPTVRYITNEDRRACAESGIALHVYSATANGYFEREEDHGPFTGNSEARERVRSLAKRLGRTPTQIALAWLLNQPASVVPIIGTTKPNRIREAFGAIDLALDELTRSWLRGQASPGAL